MGIVWPCRLDVEAYAAGGRKVAVPRARCPRCREPLIFWSGYRRYARRLGASIVIWIRRAKCRPCGVTHALLPAFLLQRRLDPVAVIGTAVARMVSGAGVRPVAEAVGVPHSTARGWRRRHREHAAAWLTRVEAVLAKLGAELLRGAPDIEHAVVDALVDAWRRTVARAAQGEPVGLWQFVSAVTGGSWLGTTTSAPWAGVSGRPFIPTTSSRAP